MASKKLLLLLLWAFTSLVRAEYGIWQNAAYTSADACAQQCAAYAYGYNAYSLCNVYETGGASCLCNIPAHSSTMDVSISLCPTASACGGSIEASQGLAIFSEYCSLNRVAAAALTTAVAATAASNPTAATQASPTDAQATSTSTMPSTSSVDSSDNNNGSNDNNNSSSNGISTSDKIAIACAIGGAIVTIAVAVPTWIHMKKKKANSSVESQPLHPQPPMANPPPYNPVQQPFIHQTPQQQPFYYQRQNAYGWPSWR